MNLKDLAKTPTLTKITLDDEDVVKEYGEPLEFYSWDRQPMDQFLRIASIDRNDISALAGVMKDLVLDEAGNKILLDGVALPPKVLVAVFSKLVSTLGK